MYFRMILLVTVSGFSHFAEATHIFTQSLSLNECTDDVHARANTYTFDDHTPITVLNCGSVMRSIAFFRSGVSNSGTFLPSNTHDVHSFTQLFLWRFKSSRKFIICQSSNMWHTSVLFKLYVFCFSVSPARLLLKVISLAEVTQTSSS